MLGKTGYCLSHRIKEVNSEVVMHTGQGWGTVKRYWATVRQEG